MATKLKKMKLTSVDLVRAGANQEADICLFKSADPPEATELPSEGEKNIFKRFLNWLRENPAEAENEPQNHIEKAEETPDLEYIYKSALAESLQSIMQDETLTDIEKKRMTEQSFQQYNDKIQELENFDEDYDGGDDVDEKLIEEIDNLKSADSRFDETEEVEKYNHNHDAMGRFTDDGHVSTHDKYWHEHQGKESGSDSSSSGGGGTSPASNAMNRFIQTSSKPVHAWSPSGKMTTVSGGRQDGKAGHDGSHQRAGGGKTSSTNSDRSFGWQKEGKNGKAHDRVIGENIDFTDRTIGGDSDPTWRRNKEREEMTARGYTLDRNGKWVKYESGKNANKSAFIDEIEEVETVKKKTLTPSKK